MVDKKGKLTDWVFLFVSLTLIILLLIFSPEWFWVMLPFVGLFAVRSLNVI